MRWLLLSLLACSGADTPSDSPAPVNTGDTGSTLTADTAGGDTHTGDTPTTAAPIVVGTPTAWLQGDPSPLLGWLAVDTDVPTTLTVHVNDGLTQRDQAFPEATEHEVMLLGLKADRTHTLTATLTSAQGSLELEPMQLTTPPLPADFPPLQVDVSEPSLMEPGYTLFGYLDFVIMVDQAGEVVFYTRTNGGSIHELHRTDAGLFRMVLNRTHILEFNHAGEVTTGWRSNLVNDPNMIEIDTLALHHDVQELPNGDLITLSIERREIADYPTSDSDPLAPTATAWVAGDVVTEFARNGSVVAEYKLLDLLNPTRIGYDAVRGDYWENLRPWQGDDIKDWSHANALSYDPGNDAILVGLRHQDAVISIDRASGSLNWIFAPPTGWGALDSLVLAPQVGAEQPYHMHSAKLTAGGELMLFDNGNRRASAFETILPDESNVSRGAAYVIDPATGTWTETFAFGEENDPQLFSGSLGDTDPLPQTDHVLVTWGNIKPAPGIPAARSRIQEVSRTHEVLFDMWIIGGGTVYRAQHLPTLYP